MTLATFLERLTNSSLAGFPEAFTASPGPRGPRYCLGGLAIASPHDPEREARLIIQRLFASPPSSLVVFGTGLGHLVDAALDAKPDLPVFIFEPCPQWVPCARSLRPDAPLWQADTVQWFGPDQAAELERAVQEAHPANLAWYANNAWAKAWPELHTTILHAVEACRFRRQVNVNTLHRFGRLWVRNLIHNRELFAAEAGIAVTTMAFAGLPGLLIAGGPSLDAIIPHLPALRERCVVVAVDTALRACLRAGIEPDFLCVVDPQYWNSKHLDHLTMGTGIVVAEPSASPRSIRKHAGSLLFCSSLFPLGAMLEQDCGHKGTLGAGGSVATSAWDFLRQCGVSRIIAAGLDLSFPESKTHFHGSYFEESLHTISRRTRPASDGAWRYLVDANAQPCEAVGGGTVLSDQRMAMYAHWFEEQCQSHGECPTTRLQAPHRVLRGIGSESLDQALTLPPVREAIDARLACVRSAMAQWREQARSFDTRGRSLATLRRLDAEIASLVTIARRGEAVCRSMLENGLDPQGFDELESIDQAVLGSPDKRLLGFLLEDLLQTIQTRPAPTSLHESVQQSLDLYTAVAEAGDFHRRLWATHMDTQSP